MVTRSRRVRVNVIDALEPFLSKNILKGVEFDVGRAGPAIFMMPELIAVQLAPLSFDLKTPLPIVPAKMPFPLTNRE